MIVDCCSTNRRHFLCSASFKMSSISHYCARIWPLRQSMLWISSITYDSIRNSRRNHGIAIRCCVSQNGFCVWCHANVNSDVCQCLAHMSRCVLKRFSAENQSFSNWLRTIVPFLWNQFFDDFYGTSFLLVLCSSSGPLRDKYITKLFTLNTRHNLKIICQFRRFFPVFVSRFSQCH